MKAEDVDAALVEKAARATYYADPFYRSVFGKILEPREVLPWDELDLADIQEMRNNTRRALAAVLPEVRAEAWEEGFLCGAAETSGIELSDNPYRPTATEEEAT